VSGPGLVSPCNLPTFFGAFYICASIRGFGHISMPKTLTEVGFGWSS
jgi:hypothetical protein